MPSAAAVIDRSFSCPAVCSSVGTDLVIFPVSFISFSHQLEKEILTTRFRMVRKKRTSEKWTTTKKTMSPISDQVKGHHLLNKEIKRKKKEEGIVERREKETNKTTMRGRNRVNRVTDLMSSSISFLLSFFLCRHLFPFRLIFKANVAFSYPTFSCFLLLFRSAT